VDAKTGAPFFEATVEVEPDDLAGDFDSAGRRFELRAGLPAEVIVTTRERTALEYFLEPLTRLLRVSGRED
jgi:HlyD family secretion protein